eukprot:61148_1
MGNKHKSATPKSEDQDDDNFPRSNDNIDNDQKVSYVKGGLQNEAVQQCLEYLTDVFNNNFNHNQPNALNISEYINIHGGCCRDVILNNPIKDIDLSIDLNGLHKHAKHCHNKRCKLKLNYLDNLAVYETMNGDILYTASGSPYLKNSKDLLHGYIMSDKIINAKMLLKALKTNKDFNKHCSSIKGPNVRSPLLVTHQIYFKNGVDIDIMECSSYLTTREFLDEFSWTSNCWPITHELQARLSDATFNALFIPISAVVGVHLSKWSKYVVDPYDKYKMARPVKHNEMIYGRKWEKFIVSGIRDLQNGVVRQYDVYRYMRSQCGQGNGQWELIIFRTIKNVHKLNGAKFIYIDEELQQDVTSKYSEWFTQTNMTKKTKHGDGMDSILHHAFNHNYFKTVDEDDIIIGVFHLLMYDQNICNFYAQNKKFKRRLDNLLPKLPKRASCLWQRMKETVHLLKDADDKKPKKYKCKYMKCTLEISARKFNTVPFDGRPVNNHDPSSDRRKALDAIKQRTKKIEDAIRNKGMESSEESDSDDPDCIFDRYGAKVRLNGFLVIHNFIRIFSILALAMYLALNILYIYPPGKKKK